MFIDQVNLVLITQRTNLTGYTKYKVGHYQYRLCSKLPELLRYNVVITVVDSVSKRVHFILTHTTVTAEGTVRLFLHHVWKLWSS